MIAVGETKHEAPCVRDDIHDGREHKLQSETEYMTQDRNNQRRPKPLEDRGNVGIIRSPLRASILPDYIGSPDAAGCTQLR